MHCPSTLAVVLALSLSCFSTAFAEPTTPAYLDPAQPLTTRVTDLVSRLTVEEKASLMMNGSAGVPRLGIPKYDWWNEALHGVARAGEATVFPQAIGLAAMWDDDFMATIADTIGTEARAKYNAAIRQNNRERYFGLTFWTPNVNIFRDPRWGRGQETYGEDPFLTARLGVAFVRSLQGNDPQYLNGVLWALNNTGQNGGINDADMDAPEGWSIRNQATNIIVAVIDTGIRCTHEDLAAKVASASAAGKVAIVLVPRS